MKLINTKRKEIKTLSFKLFKTKDDNKKSVNYNLEKTLEFRFKNALNIIYKFHCENKKILFIGTPLKLTNKLQKIFKNTKHSFIPEKIWLNGVLTNTKSVFKFLFKKYFKQNKNNIKYLFTLTNKYNLAVIANEFLNDKPLKEFSGKRIAIISLNYNSINLNNFNATYKIKQNYCFNENKNINDIFYSILVTTLKKAEKIRVKKIKNNLKKKRLTRHNMQKRKFKQRNVFFKKK